MAQYPQYMPIYPIVYHDDPDRSKSFDSILKLIENADNINIEDHDVKGSPNLNTLPG